MARRIKTGASLGDQIQYGTMPDADRQFVKDALQKGATRRQVMGWLIAMGATAGSAGSIIGSATQAIAATPKKGGSLRFAWDQHGPADTLDPTLYTNNLDYVRGRTIYGSLTRIVSDLSAEPELAESFEPNANATEWVFKLRKDVEWHDGSKLTADDVIYSMNRHIGKDTKSKAASLVKNVKEWKKDDAHTVRAILSSPNAELPVVLGTFHFKIVKNGTTDFSKPVGTGPFTVEEFKPGVRSTHKRFDGYWDSANGPFLDEIELFAITDNVARVSALISGDIQMMGNLNPKSISQIEAAKGVEVFSLNSGAYMDIISRFDTSYAGANNLDFVKGLKHLMRRDRILQVVQKGIGDIGNDQPVGPAYGEAWCKDANDPVAHPYDPDKAKFHLKKAGITSAELKVAEVGPGLTDICLLLQRECAKVGFNLNVKKVPNDGYWGAIWLKDPLHVSSWNMRPTANIMMTLAYASDAKWNESAWKNERFDKLLVEARGETDAAKRKEMNCELQKICSEKCGTIIGTHRAYVDATSSKVKGLPRVPIAANGGQEWPQFAWLDS